MARMISSFGPVMERALRLRQPAIHQPRWLSHHHHVTAGLLLSDGGYHPRPESWGVPLCHRFVRPASPIQRQTRVFSEYLKYNPKIQGEGEVGQATKKPWDEFCRGKNILRDALRAKEKEEVKGLMLRGLGILEEVATDKNYCSNDYNAKKLLDEVMRPISNEGVHGLLYEGTRSSVVHASLKAIWQLLQTAPVEICTTLGREISTKDKVKRIMENIRDNGECDDMTRDLAREILRTTTLNSQGTNDGELS